MAHLVRKMDALDDSTAFHKYRNGWRRNCRMHRRGLAKRP
jgi:hypothetical protein